MEIFEHFTKTSCKLLKFVQIKNCHKIIEKIKINQRFVKINRLSFPRKCANDRFFDNTLLGLYNIYEDRYMRIQTFK